MSFRLTSDPSERIRKVEKILLMLRFVWRFSPGQRRMAKI